MDIANNFGPDDLYLTTTYGGEDVPDEKGLRTDIKNLISRLKYKYKKLGLPFKCISTTHCKTQRPNHHLIISGGVDRKELVAMWPHGFVRIAHLYTDGDYRGLAHYLIKESAKRFRDPDAVFRHRYYRTRNIEVPETCRKEVPASEFMKPVPPPGYTIDPESDYEGMNPITGRMYREYVLVPESKDSKYRKRRGARAKPMPDGNAAWLRRNLEYQYEIDITEYGGGVYDDA
jgi:hypothetical protein